MILIFDTSTEGFLIGLLDQNSQFIDQIRSLTPYGHTELLIPTILGLFETHGLDFQDLTSIITTKGPGSFTGLRVGLSVAVGLQCALNIPVTAVNTLHAIAYSWIISNNIRASGRIHVMIDTKCHDVYHQIYGYETSNLTAKSDPVSVSIPILKDMLQPDDVLLTLSESTHIFEGIDCQFVNLTLDGIRAASQHSALDLTPLYVRPVNTGISSN